MPTPIERRLSEAEKNVREADVMLSKIPPGSPSYIVMNKIIYAMRDTLEVIRGLMPEVEA